MRKMFTDLQGKNSFLFGIKGKRYSLRFVRSATVERIGINGLLLLTVILERAIVRGQAADLVET
jgi:hypothetical protein